MPSKEFQILHIFFYFVLFPDCLHALVQAALYLQFVLFTLSTSSICLLPQRFYCLLRNLSGKILDTAISLQLIPEKFIKMRSNLCLFTNCFCILLIFLVLPAFILYLLWLRLYAPWFIWCRAPFYIRKVQYKSINNNDK